jgi:tRNA pseudouridine-54 N-methylase
MLEGIIFPEQKLLLKLMQKARTTLNLQAPASAGVDIRESVSRAITQALRFAEFWSRRNGIVIKRPQCRQEDVNVVKKDTDATRKMEPQEESVSRAITQALRFAEFWSRRNGIVIRKTPVSPRRCKRCQKDTDATRKMEPQEEHKDHIESSHY